MNAHRKQLLGNVAKMSDYFRARLSLMEFDGAATLHIQGLAVGIELKEDYADTLQKKCRKAGLLTSTEENSLLLLPPLNITDDVAKRGLDILERCVES
jgi:putrescine aminotransferase/taurine--2-oxoglutarate transaminase